jgi:hypothetical protein
MAREQALGAVIRRHIDPRHVILADFLRTSFFIRHVAPGFEAVVKLWNGHPDELSDVAIRLSVEGGER